MKAPRWLIRFWKDMIQKEFIPLKILFFLIYGASMALFPFLTLQARSLGINERELGVIYAFNPVIAILGPPITGIIADKIGNFKIFLSITMAASGCAAITFSLVPPGRKDHDLPEKLPMTLTCGGPFDSEPHLRLDEPYHCDYLPDVTSVNVSLSNCTLCGTDRSLEIVADEEQQLCEEEGGDESSSKCRVSRFLNNMTHELTAKPFVRVEGKEGSSRLLQVEKETWSCPEASLESIDLAVADTASYSSEQSTALHSAANCLFRCQATILRDSLCSNKVAVEDINSVFTFWCYILVRVLNTLTLATSFTLFDGAAIAVVREHHGDYGLQRLYANLGGIVITPISGQLIDYFSKINNFQDYSPAFYMYCGLKVSAAVIILFVSLDFRQPSTRVLTDLRMLIKKPEIVSFLTVMLITGTCYGLLDTFLFWLLQDLGASKFLMGITVTVGSLAGVPILIASGSIFKKIGLPNTIVLGMFTYFVRLLGYSFLTNPWWCMPFESLECFTVSLIGAAAVSYAADLSTPATLATLQGVYGGLHYGVGRGLGSLLGGFLLKPLGVRNTFRLTGTVCLVVGIIYFFVNRIFFRKLQEERRKINEEEKKMKEKEAANEMNATSEKQSEIIENGRIMPNKENVPHNASKENENPNSTEVKENDAKKTEMDNAAFVEDEH